MKKHMTTQELAELAIKTVEAMSPEEKAKLREQEMKELQPSKKSDQT